ncbi:MAG TPA: HAMP domain-containing sensor histidine kinase [Solirubrobacteraceae bacterium]|jgi:two-component system, OmpR family, sensor kinase|nr:HAMP domain-containing sensor histidine kinase [Solirubrobacteraceae bacterium]
MRLQRRVLGYLAAAAIASCVLTVGVGVVLVRHQIAKQRLSTLEAQADLVAAVGGAPGALTPGDHVYRVGNGRPRRLGPRAQAVVLAALPSGGAGQGTIEVAGRSLIYAARLTTAGEIVLIRPANIAFAEWRPFMGSLLLAGLGGVLLAVVLSYLLARRLTRPIGELSAATRRLAHGEAGVSVPVRGEDELADLGTSFNDMSDELSRAREAQGRFLESVSHELRTPLTSIRGYAEALEEGAIPPDESARVIGAEADRLERLVADLLDLARFGRSGFAVAREPVNLAGVVEASVERHLPRARQMGVELSGTGPSDSWVLGDHDRILQAVSNLIENALRVTPAGGSVTVAAGPGQITVRDSGPGLDPDDIPRAFERFYLYGRYRSERPVGSGLGLAIVKELISAMGGAVEATTGREGSAAFTIRLPSIPARSALPDAVQPSA